MRWDYYFLAKNDQLQSFWHDRLTQGEHDVLLLLASGFDPRMCSGLSMLLNAGGDGRRDAIVLEFDEGQDSPSHALKEYVDANRQRLQDLLQGKGNIQSRNVRVLDADGRRVESVSAAQVFSSLSEFEAYTDVVFDISALPRGIYFPILAKLLYLCDEARRLKAGARVPNLHVLVAENAELDSRITQEGVEESAQFIHGFSGGAQQEASASVPCIWMPLLGEAQEAQIRVIQDFVKPNEILPILPSPARNPRRADNLVIEYREVLFDSLRLDPRNFIYAHEQNPFEVYRQLSSVISRYRRSLKPLGGARFVLSALSSKLMSLGTLLVAYELKPENIIGLAHVSSHGYRLPGLPPGDTSMNSSELFGLWLGGEYYQ